MSNAVMLGMILHILNYGRTKGSVLADIFEISPRTVLRYIDNISSTGVPIISFFGRTGGYEIDANFSLNHNFLTKKEKDLIIKLLNKSNDTESKLLIEKIKYMKSIALVS